MSNIFHTLEKIEKVIRKTVLGITGAGMVLITAIIFVQVICRYVLQSSLSWSEELTRYLMIWIVFLGSGYVLGIGAHSNMDIVSSKLPEHVKNIVDKGISLLLVVFSLVIIRYGCSMVLVGAAQKSSALHLPMSLVYLAIPIGGVIMLFYSVMLLLKKGGKA